ncbi:MAG: NAD-dependent epimerase/dehydratase family protein [Putridiphycobacter sp.]
MENLKNKRVFVSGGAGVIGSELIPILIDKGAIVMCGDLMPRPAEFSDEVIYRQGDLNYLTQEEINLFNPEIFIHLAATFERSAETYEHWEENFWHNIRLSNHLMTLIRNVDAIKRVVNASSYLIYDKSLYQFREAQEIPTKLKETDIINPRNLTGLAKLAHEIELEFLSHFKSDKFTSISARIYRGYGKNSRDVISRWVRYLLNNKEITVYNQDGFFDYMYAEDTANGLLRLAMINDQGIVNLGTGRSRQVKDIIDILKKYFPNLKAKYVKIDEPIESSEADTTKLHELINWLPEKYLEETIPEIIEFEKNKNNNPLELKLGNFLITSISAKVSMINDVKKAANKLNPKIKVFGGDIDTSCMGRYFVDGFWEMPRLDNLTKDDITKYCKENNIRIIIPSRDGELLYFSKLKDTLKENDIHVMISDFNSVNNCVDKLLFYTVYELKIPEIIPTSENIDQINSSSYVVKERYGAGAKSIGINLSKEEALNHSKNLRSPIFQPYVSGDEYSVDAYITKDKMVKGLIIRKRHKVVNGESQITFSFYNKTIEEKIKKIVESLNLYGHIVLQLFLTEDGEINVIECNTRFGGASSLSVYLGLDSFYWGYLESLGHNIENYPFTKNNKTIAQVKYVENKYIEVNDNSF